MASRRRRSRPTDPISDFPAWIAPQLTELVAKVPAGDEWAHEIKLDGYRMHARTDRGQVQLLTRTGLDWTAKYTTTAAALQGLPVQQAYLDGELCAVSETGVTSFSLMQAATDGRRTSALVFYAFDLLHLDGQNLMCDPLLQRKQRLQRLLNGYAGALRYCDHQIGMGPQFYEHACQLKLECCRSGFRRRLQRFDQVAGRQRTRLARSTLLKSLRCFAGLHPVGTPVNELIIDTRSSWA